MFVCPGRVEQSHDVSPVLKVVPEPQEQTPPPCLPIVAWLQALELLVVLGKGLPPIPGFCLQCCQASSE
eukprot:8586348-Prorocentrum_lima.AAC.1